MFLNVRSDKYKSFKVSGIGKEDEEYRPPTESSRLINTFL